MTDAVWLGVNGGYNLDSNWSTNQVPDGTATFLSTGTIFITVGTSIIGGWTFGVLAQDYDFTHPDGSNFVFTGAGIDIQGGSATITNNGGLDFDNSSAGAAWINNFNTLGFEGTGTAGSATITNAIDGIVEFIDTSTAAFATIVNFNSSSIDFNDASNAGIANITNNDNAELSFNNSSDANGATIVNNATLTFDGSSTANNADITNNISGTVDFRGSSTAGAATIVSDGLLQFFNSVTAGNATIVNNDSGSISFQGSSKGGTANITNDFLMSFNESSDAEDATIINNAALVFLDSSTAGSAIITNNQNTNIESTAANAVITNTATGILNILVSGTAGASEIINDGVVNFNDNATASSATIINNNNVQFSNNSTAGDATIITSAGGTTTFIGNSSGGNAQFITGTGGSVDFGGSTGANDDGRLTAGSIAGAGDYLIDGIELAVGSNNLSTVLNGTIGGINGSLVKAGIGTLTISGAANPSDSVAIDDGGLQVDGTLTTDVISVNAGGTLSGNGVVTSNTLVVNQGGTLAPGASAGLLTVNDIAFMAGAAFAVELDGTIAGDDYDQLNVAGTVSLGNASLQVSVGFVTMTGDEFIIIDNDDVDPVQGTFAGLAQGAELQIGNRLFVIDYAAGDGNDVSLTTQGAVITGNSAANIINGSSSVGSQPFATNFRDLISGNGADDKISGLGGNDTLNGGNGDDTLKGGADNDTLTGGKGRDFQYGDSGRDVFDYNSIKDSVVGSQRDKIQDFKHGQHDKIDLRDIDAKTASGKFKWVGTDDFSDKKGELRYIDKGSKVIVQGDVNGDGKADFEIYVVEGSLAKGDFLL